MNLDLNKDRTRDTERNFIKDFINELSNYLQKENRKLEIENGFYQVVDFGNNSVFLQNMDTNKVFEEKNLPEEIKNKISNDYVLKYEDGKYSIDMEKTDRFFNGMVDIKELQKK